MVGNRRRRSWRSFGVRTMLIAILAVAVWLGYWINGARDQQAAVAAIRGFDAAANLEYDNEYIKNPNNSAGGMGGMAIMTESRAWWMPAPLERRLGKDYFHTVVSVAFGQGEPDPGASRRGEILREVARLRNLRQLALYTGVSDADALHLAGLRSLKRLEFGEDCPELTDASLRTLSRLSNLEALEIRNAPITDAGLAHLGRMPQLKSLTLGDAQPFSPGGNSITITGGGLAHLAGLPGLTELEIHSAALTGDGLKQLGSLRHLKRLRLKGGSFLDDDLRSLAELTGLESLQIVGSSIDGTGLRHLAGLSKVTEICLEGPNVTDAAIPYLARLPSLRSVMIYGTRVTAEGLEGFRVAPQLRQMGLVPAVIGETNRLKQALPSCRVFNGGRSL